MTQHPFGESGIEVLRVLHRHGGACSFEVLTAEAADDSPLEGVRRLVHYGWAEHEPDDGTVRLTDVGRESADDALKAVDGQRTRTAPTRSNGAQGQAVTLGRLRAAAQRGDVPWTVVDRATREVRATLRSR